MAALLLPQLATKAALDDAIRSTKDKVLVLRFGRATDIVCMQQDDIVRLCVLCCCSCCCVDMDSGQRMRLSRHTRLPIDSYTDHPACPLLLMRIHIHMFIHD